MKALSLKKIGGATWAIGATLEHGWAIGLVAVTAAGWKALILRDGRQSGGEWDSAEISFRTKGSHLWPQDFHHRSPGCSHAHRQLV